MAIAGLHVAAYVIEGKAKITTLAAVLSVAIPVGWFVGLMCALSYYLVRRFRPLDVWLLTASSGVAMISTMAALSGISLVACLMILMLAPTVTVVSRCFMTSPPLTTSHRRHGAAIDDVLGPL
jgi:hypothetical protein